MTTDTRLDDLLVAVALHAGWSWIPYRWYDDSVKKLLWNYAVGQPKGDDFYDLPDGSLLPWPGNGQLPNYPHDIAAALSVLESMEHYAVEIEKHLPGKYMVRVWRDGWGYDETGKTAAEALCRAFLKSQDHPVTEEE